MAEKPPLYKGPFELYEEEKLADGGFKTTIVGQVVDMRIAAVICSALNDAYERNGLPEHKFFFRKPLFPATLIHLPLTFTD